MFSSIALGPDGQANHTLNVLRGKSRQGALADRVKFMPGFSLHADPELQLTGRYSSPKGRLLELDATTGASGGWIGLHLAFSAHNLKDFGMLGFAARTSAPETTVLRACLRSGTKDSFIDCFFDKHMLLRPEEASHLDALPVGYRDDLPTKAEWRELILFLPTETFRLSLIDLRVFLV